MRELQFDSIKVRATVAHLSLYVLIWAGITIGICFAFQILKSPLSLSGRRLRLGLGSGPFGRGTAYGPGQEKHGAPTDFLIEFRTAFFIRQPDSLYRAFGGHFAEGTVHL